MGQKDSVGDVPISRSKILKGHVFCEHEHNRQPVWGHIMERLRNDPPLTVADLRQRFRQHWDEWTPQYLESLYARLPFRVAALRRARSYPTEF